MNEEIKKEILKSVFYKMSNEDIQEIYDISKEELDKIVEEDNGKYLKELEMRANDYWN